MSFELYRNSFLLVSQFGKLIKIQWSVEETLGNRTSHRPSEVNRFESLSLRNSAADAEDDLSDRGPKGHFGNPCIGDIA